MIRDIYDWLQQDASKEDVLYRKMHQEIMELLAREEGEPEGTSSERLKSQAFEIAAIAEESGFVRGFRYAFRMFWECLDS